MFSFRIGGCEKHSGGSIQRICNDKIDDQLEVSCIAPYNVITPLYVIPIACINLFLRDKIVMGNNPIISIERYLHKDRSPGFLTFSQQCVEILMHIISMSYHEWKILAHFPFGILI